MHLNLPYEHDVYQQFVQLLKQALEEVVASDEDDTIMLFIDSASERPHPNTSFQPRLAWSVSNSGGDISPSPTWRLVQFRLGDIGDGYALRVILTDDDTAEQVNLFDELIELSANTAEKGKTVPSVVTARAMVQTAVRFIRARVLPTPGELQKILKA